MPESPSSQPLPLRSPLASLCKIALDTLLPPVCLLCGKVCGVCNRKNAGSANGGNDALCAACENDLPQPQKPHCPVCLAATAHGEQCGACLCRPPDFARIHALYRYAFPIDRLIHSLKYHAALALADVWGRKLAQLTAEVAADVVLPLPLHPLRMRERGYNQALEIARALARARGLALDHKSLEKTRHTLPQTGLTEKARSKNPRGAFACHRDFSGQTLLLVDDVFTTGATVGEAARVLKLHGAKETHVAVVARAERYMS